MERRIDLDETFSIRLKRIDRDAWYLIFYQNGQMMLEIPPGYQLYLVLENKDKEEQTPFYGSFVLSKFRDYILEYKQKTRIQFCYPKEHAIFDSYQLM